MAYKQVKKFDQERAGSKPLYCLQNTRLGFTIQPKYPNAITAWENTQQHPNRNIPKGLDVPLYYSFKTDGHINVQLANGKLWSDGKVYANLAAYEAASSPVYLGWGESVNGERVIVKEQDMPTKEEVKDMFGLIGREPDYGYTKKPTIELAKDIGNVLYGKNKELKAALAKCKKEGPESDNQALKDKLFNSVKKVFGR